MRLSIIANCQKDSLATCIAALNHGFEIDHYMIHEVMANPTQLRAILEFNTNIIHLAGLTN